MKIARVVHSIFLLFFLSSCTETNSDGATEASTAPELSTFLDENPSLKSNLLLEQTYPAASYYYSGSPVELDYDNWSAEDQEALRVSFERAWYNIYDNFTGSEIGSADFAMPVPCTDCSSELSLNPTAKPTHRVTESVGKSVYLAYAAHSLALEAGSGLNWSVASADPSELHHYFNSRSLVHRLGYSSTEFFVGSWTVSPDVVDKYLGDGSPATPIYAYSFLRNNSIIADDHQQTVYNLGDWFRNNGVHFYFGYERQNAFDHWQFPGQVPASRVMDGTIRDGESSAQHWTAGCHGTAAFFKSVLKSVNIPVQILKVCGHAVLYFPTLGVYMDHGDNPYNANVRTQSAKSIGGIFIDETTFTSRFGANPHLMPSSDPSCTNIGKAAQDF